MQSIDFTHAGAKREDYVVPDPRMRALFEAVSCLLATQMDHFSPCSQAMLKRQGDYMSTVPIRVCVGTWNVNGGSQFKTVAFHVCPQQIASY